MASKPEKPRVYVFAPWKEQSTRGKIQIVKGRIYMFFLFLIVAAISLNLHGELEMYLTILFYWAGKFWLFVKGIF